jgi:RNA polymerase sigma factor (sigma-70 family)
LDVPHGADDVIDHWRIEGRADRVQVPLDELKQPASKSDTPEQAYATKERQAFLLTAMSDLEKEDRSLLALKFAGQRTNREIAHILKVSEGVVSMRLLRALRKLRQRLDHMGVA